MLLGPDTGIAAVWRVDRRSEHDRASSAAPRHGVTCDVARWSRFDLTGAIRTSTTDSWPGSSPATNRQFSGSYGSSCSSSDSTALSGRLAPPLIWLAGCLARTKEAAAWQTSARYRPAKIGRESCRER